MSALWEWIGTVQVTAEVVRRFTVPPSAGTYGDVIDQAIKPPQSQHTFIARGQTTSEIAAVLAAVGGPYSLTDSMGRSWSGTLMSATGPSIAGTTRSITTIQLRI